MNNWSANEKLIDDVVQHMNEDHSDACLVIVNTLGRKPHAKAALMTNMDAMGVSLLAIMQDGSEEPVRVEFEKPVTRDNQIRGYIVALTRRARAAFNS